MIRSSGRPSPAETITCAIIDRLEAGSVVDMLPPDVPLVWVNTFRRDHADASAVFNEVLVDELSHREHSVVASWYDQASRDDETQVLRDDGVHPNEHGRVVFAALVAQAIAAVA